MSCTAAVLVPSSFFPPLGTDFNVNSLISLKRDMSVVTVNSVPKKEKHTQLRKNFCST
jgi:hypothetical protein